MIINKKNTNPLEHIEQKEVFLWIRQNQDRYPKLKWVFSTLNGVRLQPKLRKEMKLQGNRKGVFDIVLPFKSHDDKYPGMYLELKRLKLGTVSTHQEEFGVFVASEGYEALVCKGHVTAIFAIKRYMGIK
jgi:hypothetical protein